MKWMVIGANGQLGSDLVEVLADETVIALTHADVEVSDSESVDEIVAQHKPEVVINTAAYHKVEECEKSPDKAFGINATGALNVAQSCKAYGATLVYISTDYVFDGRKGSPYVESDLPMPLNVYGTSKLAGEYLTRHTLERHFIVRTTGLYGAHECRAKGGNFIDLMLRLAREHDEIRVVNDEVLTPTYTFDLSYQIRSLSQTNHYGLYHMTNNGQCSWYEFARAIFDILGMNVNLVPTTSDEFPRPVERPAYSVLQNKALQDLRLDQMQHWQQALRAYLESRTSLED